MPAPSIIGYGEMADFSPLSGRSPLEAAAEAALAATADAGVELSAIDGVIAGNPMGGGSMFGTNLANYLGLTPAHCSTISLGGASGAGAVARAAMAIEVGVCKTVLAVYGDARTSAQSDASWEQALSAIASLVSHPDFERPYGLTAAAGAALIASDRLRRWRTDDSVLAAVAVAAHEYARHAERALRSNPLTPEGMIRSPMVAEPLRGYDCALVSDFGGALLVTASESAASNSVQILGYGESTYHKYLSGAIGDVSRGAAASAQVAYDRAGVTPASIDIAEVYDAFTIYVPVLLEELGLCPKGSAPAHITEGGIARDGSLPCNTNGGMLAYAHGGILHVTEAVRQLRGEAETPRQVDAPQTALVHGIGGSFSHHVTLILGI